RPWSDRLRGTFYMEARSRKEGGPEVANGAHNLTILHMISIVKQPDRSMEALPEQFISYQFAFLFESLDGRAEKGNEIPNMSDAVPPGLLPFIDQPSYYAVTPETLIQEFESFLQSRVNVPPSPVAGRSDKGEKGVKLLELGSTVTTLGGVAIALST